MLYGMFPSGSGAQMSKPYALIGNPFRELGWNRHRKST